MLNLEVRNKVSFWYQYQRWYQYNTHLYWVCKSEAPLAHPWADIFLVIDKITVKWSLFIVWVLKCWDMNTYQIFPHPLRNYTYKQWLQSPHNTYTTTTQTAAASDEMQQRHFTKHTYKCWQKQQQPCVFPLHESLQWANKTLPLVKWVRGRLI